MSGAYTLQQQWIMQEGADTVFTRVQQLKMYNGDFVMYAGIAPGDSTCSFGVGTYSVRSDTITEAIFFSASNTVMSSMDKKYRLLVSKEGKGFKQVIPDFDKRKGKKRTLSETYTSVGITLASPLDGLWKEDKAYFVVDQDTSIFKATQYKMYHAGYFIYGQIWFDTQKKMHTAAGFGSFSFEGKDNLKEHVLVSTYNMFVNKTVEVTLEMLGTDKFKQTIYLPDGSQTVEHYSRIKLR